MGKVTFEELATRAVKKDNTELHTENANLSIQLGRAEQEIKKLTETQDYLIAIINELADANTKLIGDKLRVIAENTELNNELLYYTNRTESTFEIRRKALNTLVQDTLKKNEVPFVVLEKAS